MPILTKFQILKKKYVVNFLAEDLNLWSKLNILRFEKSKLSDFRGPQKPQFKAKKAKPFKNIVLYLPEVFR